MGTTATLVAETLVLTKANREKLEAAFLETRAVQAKRARVLLPYHMHTVDQIILAMYASADATNDEINVTPRNRATMSRSLAVVKAWVTTKADELVEDEDVDHCLQLLTQIADVTPGNLAKYLVPEKDRTIKGQQWGIITVYPLPTASEQFDPFEVEVEFGAGEKAVAAILAEYLDQRVETDPAEALEWLTRYRRAVVYANNEHRRNAKKHNTRAADARKGDGDGSSKKGKAHNAGGTGGKAAKEAELAKERAAAKASKAAKKPRTAAQRPLAEASVGDLLTQLALRTADYDTAITVAESRAKDDLDTMWEKRFNRVPVGMTQADVVKGKGKKRTVRKPVTFAGVATVAPSKIPALYAVTPEAKAANAVNTGAMPANSAQANRILLAEQHAGRVTAKKRKELVLAIMDGSMNEAQFKSALEKITRKAAKVKASA